MTPLLQILIPALVTLLVAFGVLYLSQRKTGHDRLETESAAVKVAKVGADVELLGILLDRIEKLETRVDEQSQRTARREARIEGLEQSNVDCKRELTEILNNYTLLKKLMEKQFGVLTEIGQDEQTPDISKN